MENNFWRQCSSCKSPISFEKDYYRCSVSTCQQKRTNYVFCSVPCFERHLPGARHKDAWAEQETAPTQAQAAAAAPQADMTGTGGQRRIIAQGSKPQVSGNSHLESEILVVVSKLKQYIKSQYDYSTSADVMTLLSDMIRRECDKAADRARADGRKTVMARDFR